MKTFLSLLAFAIGLNVVFALLTYVLFHGQITGANSFADYFYYSVGHLTTSGASELTPRTNAVRMWTSMYVLTVWVYVFYVGVNHIRNVKIGGFG
jgi:uncharacterized protein (DUF2062 family)